VEEGKPSIRAIGSAMVRAVHLLWDDEPKIFEDTLALRLCGCESEAALRAQFDRHAAELARSVGPGFTTILRRFTGTAAVRSRYVEDEVDQAIERRRLPVRDPWRWTGLFRLPPNGPCEGLARL
jgi:O-methyltransferase involved in polyketide biosynthesis